MRRVTWLFLLMATAPLASAQIYVQPKAGVAITSIRFSTTDNVQSRIGYVAGVGVNVPLDEERKFTVQPELLYVRKGARLTQVPVFGDTEYILNYLELPVLGRISTGGRPIRAYANAGPSLSYAFDGRNLAGDNDFDIKFSRSDSVNFNNRLDLGLQVGGGVGLKAGLGEIILDVRYGLGISNLYRSDLDVTARNRTFAVTISYAALLGGN